MPNAPLPPGAPERINILLVDDQPGKLLTYETMLAQLDENLVKVSSGEQALQQLLKTEFAIVLLDVCMPNIDGFELATLIRQHPRCRHTAIIFISAVNMSDVDRQRGYALGAVDYLSVPVVPELLRARVGVFADLYRKTIALQRMNQELEARVAERTAALEKDLAERKRLEEALVIADRRKDQFLAVLAHELRNPLAPIRTAVDTMWLRPIQDETLLQCRDVIGRQVEHMTRLVDDLMDISRITRGSIKLERRPVEISDVVRRAIETHRPLLDARGHALTVDMPEQPLVVEGDTTRLAEAVGNLLNNAGKYTEERGRIEVEVRRAGDAEVQVCVRDSGVGIPPELLPAVFEMFTQIDHTLHRSQGGLGIGLALVRELVEMHGGRVEGFSEGLGKGSEFVLSLPLRPDLAAAAVAARRKAEHGPATENAQPRRILVVDDNRDAAQSLATLLRLTGSEVETAHDGLQALRIADKFLPSLVLLDIGMPGMSGLDVARKIRARPWGNSVTLVAQTGWGQEEDRRKAQEAGFDVHLTKPVDHAALMKLLAPAGRSRLAETG
ncbi:MAG TPA: response regulator [Verrucomicrobiae bacterium]|nr:response regulator [Verrucomicrobiae bacterium]